MLVKELQALALDVKVLTEDRDEVKLRDYSDEEMDIDTPLTKRQEELKEVDLIGEGLFEGFGEEGGSVDNMFDTGADDDDIFGALTNTTGSPFDIFGAKDDADDEE